jgi:hypothetical protein
VRFIHETTTPLSRRGVGERIMAGIDDSAKGARGQEPWSYKGATGTSAAVKVLTALLARDVKPQCLEMRLRNFALLV